METLFLSRRNLETLIAKLDRNKIRANKGESPESLATIIKYGNKQPKYSQSMEAILIVAIEDEEYYTDRKPGTIHPADEETLKNGKV